MVNLVDECEDGSVFMVEEKINTLVGNASINFKYCDVSCCLKKAAEEKASIHDKAGLKLRFNAFSSDSVRFSLSEDAVKDAMLTFN
jgi:hypothetical protein